MKTIEESWAEMRRKLQIGGISPAQIDEMEKAFWSGAFAAVTPIGAAMDSAMPLEEFTQGVMGMVREVMERKVKFMQAAKAPRAPRIVTLRGRRN